MGIKTAFIWVVFGLIAYSGHAQETPEIHKINGKKYYLHQVEQGHTVYGISRLYSVTIEDIQRENEEALRDGLQINETLLIPVTTENKKELTPVEQQKGQLLYEVQPGETLYAISTRFQTTLEALIEANPSLKTEGLRAGTSIVIPNKSVDVEPELRQEAQPDHLKTHVVKPGETIFSLCQLYSVTAESLKEVNQGFPAGLQSGMIIRIPASPKSLPAASPAPTPKSSPSPSPSPTPSPTPVGGSVKGQDLQYTDPASGAMPVRRDSQEIRLAMLLPFAVTFPDSATTTFAISDRAREVLSFYRGFTFAVDSLSEKFHLDVHINVYDSPNDTAYLEALIKEGKLDSLDAIIGPYYTAQFERVCSYTSAFDSAGTPVFCPVPKPSKVLFKRPNAVKLQPSESLQISAMANLAATLWKDSNIAVVNSNKFQDTENLEFFKTQFARAAGVPDTFREDAIREIKLWDMNNETFRMRFPDSGSYTLFVPSKDIVFITKLLNELNNFQIDHKGKYRFRVVGLEQWQQLEESIDVQILHNLRVTLPLTQHVDYGNYLVRNFVTHFQKTHGFEPDDAAVHGFDLGNYLMQQFAFRKDTWQQDMCDRQYAGLNDGYVFTRHTDDSGVENSLVNFYTYKHYKLKKIAQWPNRGMK